MSKSNFKKIPPFIDPSNSMYAYAQARENHRCSYTQIMDVGDDSDLFLKTPVHCVRIFWYLWGICDNKYKLKKATPLTNACQARVLLLLQNCPKHRIKGPDAQQSISKWALVRENLTLVHVNNKGAGLSSYPCSLISAFIVRLLESIISKLASYNISF